MRGERQSDINIGELVRKVLGENELTVVSMQEIERLYSKIWIINLNRNGHEEVYIAKQVWKNVEREFYLSQRADYLFRDDPNYIRLEAQLDAEHGLIVSRYLELPNLKDDLINDGWPNPFLWFRRIENHFGLAGKWLRRYHSFEPTTGSLSQALAEFLDNRKAALKRLPPSTNHRLMSAVNSCTEAQVTVTHSDFCPQNIFTDGQRISVIDYGLKEWTHMSPYWDLVTFLIDLKAHANFRLRSPLHWIPNLQLRLISSFLSGYGLPRPPEVREWYVCASIRYLSLYAGALGEDGARAAWYRRNLESCLESLGKV